MLDEFLKICNFCKRTFSPQQLLDDPDVKPIGMLYDSELAIAYYLFQHEVPDCGTSFTVNVQNFRNLLAEKIPHRRHTMTEECLRHCANIDDFEECRLDCEFAPFRRFLLQMIDRKQIQLAQRAASLLP
ncbi:MAG: hypothetical protein ABIJ61_12030 [bacterium]